MHESIGKPKADVYKECLRAVEANSCLRCKAGKESIIIDALGRYLCRDCLSHSDLTLQRYDRHVPYIEHSLQIPYELTKKQTQGSDFLLDCVKNKQNAFLQAICGAGKTEMTLQAILYALNDNKRVGFAICRKQIVIQLQKKLKSFFPRTVVKSLYAESKDDKDAHLLVMTIQQLINYHQEFGLLIVDEVDAFPYSGSDFYWRITHKAKTPDGILIMMSATLTNNLKIRLAEEGFRFYNIPSRFHEEEHDLPRFLWVPNKEPRSLVSCLKPIIENWRKRFKRGLIFLPTIKECDLYARLLSQEGFKAEAFSTKTVHKEAIIARFSVCDLDLLVATSILERGITFPGIQVAVVNADSPLFDRDTLIQMCGRVGRDQLDRHGEIWFLSQYTTISMRQARSAIKRQNRLRLKEAV